MERLALILIGGFGAFGGIYALVSGELSDHRLAIAGIEFGVWFTYTLVILAIAFALALLVAGVASAPKKKSAVR